jgi:hypothetical protein
MLRRRYILALVAIIIGVFTALVNIYGLGLTKRPKPSTITPLFEYRLPGFATTSLEFYPDGTFRTYSPRHVSWIPPEIHRGRYRQDGNILILTQWVRSSPHPRLDTVRWHKVTWGVVDLLIPEYSMTIICNDYNSGHYKGPIANSDPWQYGIPGFRAAETSYDIDSTWHRNEQPNLPMPWKQYLHDGIIEARVLSLLDSAIRITLDKGELDSVFLGMDLFVPIEYFYFLPFTVTELYPRSCVVQPLPLLESTSSANDELTREVNDKRRARHLTQLELNRVEGNKIMTSVVVGMIFQSRPYPRGGQ